MCFHVAHRGTCTHDGDGPRVDLKHADLLKFKPEEIPSGFYDGCRVPRGDWTGIPLYHTLGCQGPGGLESNRVNSGSLCHTLRTRLGCNMQSALAGPDRHGNRDIHVPASQNLLDDIDMDLQIHGCFSRTGSFDGSSAISWLASDPARSLMVLRSYLPDTCKETDRLHFTAMCKAVCRIYGCGHSSYDYSFCNKSWDNEKQISVPCKNHVTSKKTRMSTTRCRLLSCDYANRRGSPWRCCRCHQGPNAGGTCHQSVVRTMPWPDTGEQMEMYTTCDHGVCKTCPPHGQGDSVTTTVYDDAGSSGSAVFFS
ncbi:hypothetical protein S40288_01586 [Stachybotrys chartarum IBT 40288]|nr:hypothetical protein S40288_01586 [Stachybotrys chartarum IBT 40288]